MSQLLALEWTSSEARLVLACAGAKRVSLDGAFSVPLSAESEPGPQIAAALAERGLSKIDAVLVAVGRTSIELRKLQLPPAPDAELPEMVRFQAMREFNELDEKWLLDFVPIDDGGDGPRTVLATALGPDVAAQIEEVCRQAGLKPRRLVLRSCATASLLARSPAAQPGQLRLVVDLLADEADLTAMVDGRVVFLRTTRLGDPLQPQALLAEIRLTMAAVLNQLGRRVEAIVLCGSDESQRSLARAIEEDLDMRSELFDPFAGLRLGHELRDHLPEHPGRFAPLLGMLLAEGEQTGHAVDFLHPRRPPQAPSRRRRLVLGGIAAAVLALAYLVYARIDQYLLADQVQQLDQQSKDLDAAVTRADKIRKEAGDIGKWVDGEVIWLEHLRTMSKDCPDSQHIALSQLTLSPASGGGGEMRFKGFAGRAADIAALEEALRRGSRRVIARDSREDHSLKAYSWRFEASVLVGKDAKP